MEEQNVILEEKLKREDMDRLKRGLPPKYGNASVATDNQSVAQSISESISAAPIESAEYVCGDEQELY